MAPTIKYFLLLSTIIMGILFITFFPENLSYSPTEDQIAYSILDTTTQVIQQKYHMSIFGTGMSMPEGSLKSLSLSFEVKGPKEKEWLRTALIAAAQELVTQVNNNQNIQPFLSHTPFLIKSTQIIIYVYDENRLDVYDPHISIAQISNGILSYCTKDQQKNFGYKNEFSESYEEALSFLHKNKPSSTVT